MNVGELCEEMDTFGHTLRSERVRETRVRP
jgi:hypothetical protein